MGWDAPWHWVVLAILVIALFGYKKLPDASRSLGRSLRIFKTELKGMTQDDDARNNAARDSAAQEIAPAPERTVDVSKPAPAQQTPAQQTPATTAEPPAQG